MIDTALGTTTLVRGGAGSYRAIMRDLEEHGIATRGNPDVWVQTCATLSVDDVRAVVNFAHLTPISGRKYVVLCVETLTAEAQNALLKIVEEGSGRTVFIFIVPHGVGVLPTLLSRCVVVQDASPVDEHSGETFMRMSYAERLLFVERISKDHDRAHARELVRSLLTIADNKRFPPETLRDLLDADRFLALPGSSPKSVLGHLALVV